MSFRMLAALLPLLAISPALAQTAPASPNEHGIFDSGSKTPGSEGFLTKQMLDTKLGSYATVDALTSAIGPFAPREWVRGIFFPKAGGMVETLAVSASFTPPKMTYAQATASTCTLGTIYYITDGQKFWSNASFAGVNNSQVLIASDTGQEGGFYGCVPIGSGQTRIIPLVMNYSGGAR